MENIITFSGSNEELFAREVVDNLSSKPKLIVPETHNAIVVKDGQMLQTLGSGKYFLENFVDFKNEANSILEILFLSKTAKLKLLWGTANKFLMFDVQSQTNFHIGMSGDFEVQVGDPRKFYLYIVGAAKELKVDELQERLMSNVTSMAELAVIEFAKQNKTAANQLVLHKAELSKMALKSVSEKLMKEYGIAVFSFNIANIIIEENAQSEQMVDQQNFKTCKGCGQVLSQDAKFCVRCGQLLGGGAICANCNKQNVDGAKFCAFCGHKI